jgi:hypothetical protein
LAVAAAVYVFGRNHSPDYSGTGLFGRTAQGTLPLKSWLATGVLGLAVLQLGSALWMYQVLPGLGAPPRRLGMVHRASGVALVLVTLPIAYHCMFAYGVQKFDTRITVHSLAGCFFYGAFAAKLTVVRSKRFPGGCCPWPAAPWCSSWLYSGTRAPSGTSTTITCPPFETFVLE